MAFPFSLPVFNLLANQWSLGTRPSTHPPNRTDVPCQLFFHSRAFLDIQPGITSQWVPPIFIRVPKDSSHLAGVGTIWEISQGEGLYYKVRWAERVHAGFDNEYYAALAEQCSDAGNTPRP